VSGPRAALASIALTLVLACSGGSGERGTGPSNPVAVGDVATARSSLGKSVVVIGQALQAKLGPVVVAGDLTVYCIDLPGWSDGVLGKQVSARGTLDFTQEFDAPRRQDGLQAAGIHGGVFVLRGCAYELAGR
jgi:hypothetical protein